MISTLSCASFLVDLMGGPDSSFTPQLTCALYPLRMPCESYWLGVDKPILKDLLVFILHCAPPTLICPTPG